jgi:hypothetical protein
MDEDALFPSDYSRLDLIADDPSPLKDDERAGIVKAIRLAAKDGGGRFHAGTVRPYLPKDHNPHRVGPIYSTFLDAGVIRATDIPARSGDTRNRNGNRFVPVYEVLDWEGLR